MIVFKKVKPLQKYLDSLRSKGLTIGFAPTMGALHEGHMSLIDLCKSNCDISVCSIFVNPTQFNQQSDLDNYPITIKADLNLLLNRENDVVFLPDVEEIYPDGQKYEMPYDLGNIADVFEGAERPGHFEGVVQVVDRLVEIVQPELIFMGQKDFQQFSIIQKMLYLKESPTKVYVCPIIREESGLAMSSRNVRLSVEDRKNALSLSQALRFVNDNKNTASIQSMLESSRKIIQNTGAKLEYFEIVDATTLQAVKDLSNHDFVVALVAAWVGDVRLIDNMIIKQPA